MEIRDNRQKEWLWLDNQYLNGYAKYLGVYCTVVYLSLCRHANNKTQTCFPSMKLIAEENGISIKSVERAVKILEEWGIVAIERSKKPDGKQANNIYTLTSKNIWKSKPTDSQTIGNQQTDIPKPTDSQVKSRPSEILHNYTNINNTKLTNTETSSEDVFSLKEELDKLMDSPRKDMKLIAWFLHRKNVQLSNKQQLSVAIKRHIKTAQLLVSFEGKKIKWGATKAEEDFGDKWTLETVYKLLTK